MRSNGYIYVDAQYIRKELAAGGVADTFDPTRVWEHVARVVNKNVHQIVPVRMFVYEAVDDSAPEPQKQALQEYLEKVEATPFVSVVTGFIRPGKKKRREQKGVDVQIAVDALEAATAKRADAIILISGDADFCPLAEAVRRTGAFMVVIGFKAALSQELVRSADIVEYLRPPNHGIWQPIP